MERLFGRRALLRILDYPTELTNFVPIAYLPRKSVSASLDVAERFVQTWISGGSHCSNALIPAP
jgi:hypothetical protein